MVVAVWWVVVVVVNQEWLKHSKQALWLVFECCRSDSWQRNPHWNGLMPFWAEFESTSNRTCNPQLGYSFSWYTESQTCTHTLGNSCAKPAQVALPMPCPTLSMFLILSIHTDTNHTAHRHGEKDSSLLEINNISWIYQYINIYTWYPNPQLGTSFLTLSQSKLNTKEGRCKGTLWPAFCFLSLLLSFPLLEIEYSRLQLFLQFFWLVNGTGKPVCMVGITHTLPHQYP